MISPDGQWVAYVINDSCESPAGRLTGDFLGLTNLHSGQNYRPFEQELGDHPGKPGLLVWSPGSDELVFSVNGQTWDQRGLLALTNLPLAKGDSPVSVPGGSNVGAATFAPNGHLLVAHIASRNPTPRYAVDELDDSGHVLATRFEGAGQAGSIALDPSGTRLLVTQPDGTLLEQESTAAPSPCPTSSPPCSVTTGSTHVVADGVRSAAWLPTPKPTTTNAVVPNVVGLSQEAAEQNLTQLGFNVVVNFAPGSTTRGDEVVLTQSIEAGTNASPGTAITITVGKATPGLLPRTLVAVRRENELVELDPFTGAVVRDLHSAAIFDRGLDELLSLPVGRRCSRWRPRRAHRRGPTSVTRRCRSHSSSPKTCRRPRG